MAFDKCPIHETPELGCISCGLEEPDPAERDALNERIEELTQQVHQVPAPPGTKEALQILESATTEIAAARPAPGAHLYDIGAFLAGSLNETPESMAARLVQLRENSSHLERDQEDYLAVLYDDHLDLIEACERLLAMWNDDTHVLVITEDSGLHGHGAWSIEHSLRCRALGDMAGCRYHLAMGNEALGGRVWPAGRWSIDLNDGGSDIIFRPVP